METTRYYRNPDGTVLMVSGVNVQPPTPHGDQVEEITQEDYDTAMSVYKDGRQKAVEDAVAAERAAAKAAYTVLSALPGIGPEAARYLARYSPDEDTVRS